MDDFVMSELDQDRVTKLYEKHADALRTVQHEQRALLRRTAMKAQLDDLEAEITYLLLRERQPTTVLEIGCLHGWSTSWILRALRDNAHGTLHSYDIRAHAPRRVPGDLAERWRFEHADIRKANDTIPTPDQLFIDAAHSGRFARWYRDTLFQRVPPGTTVSVHDVFHRARPWPFSEGAVLLSWLRHTNRSWYTASPAHAPDVSRGLYDLRRELGLDGTIHSGTHNPMVFFTM